MLIVSYPFHTHAVFTYSFKKGWLNRRCSLSMCNAVYSLKLLKTSTYSPRKHIQLFYVTWFSLIFVKFGKKVKSRSKRENAKSHCDARKFHKRELRVSVGSVCSFSWMSSHDLMANWRSIITYAWDTILAWRTSSQNLTISRYMRIYVHFCVISLWKSVR